MSRTNRSRPLSSRLALAAAGLVVLATAGDLFAHGTIVDSRIYRVRAAGEQANLMGAWTSAMYDWAADSNTFSDYADPNFSYSLHVPDGLIASAGHNNGYIGLNTPGAWPTKAATAGVTFHQQWSAPAPHDPSYFDVWITKPGFDVTTEAMGWDDLQKLGRWESNTALPVTSTPNGAPTPIGGTVMSYDWDITIPSDRSGRAALVVVWQRRDPVGEAFFSVQDINIAAGGPSWNIAGGGSYMTAANWSGGAVPNGVGAIANFGDKITSASTIQLGSNSPTLGTLRFNNANAYTIAGAGMLMMENDAGNSSIDVQQGTHKIDAGFMLMDSVDLNVASGAQLSMNGTVMFSSGNILTKTGPGTLRLNSPNFMGASNAAIANSGGTLHIDKPLSPTTSLYTSNGAKTVFNTSTSVGYLTTAGAGTNVTITTSAGAPYVVKAAGIGIGGNTTINVSNNVLLVDYTNETSTLAAAEAYAHDGVLGNQAGAGIISSAAASNPKLGVATVEAGAINAGTMYLNTPIDGTTVIIRAALKGDTDINGTVNFQDLVRLAQGYNKAGTWINGDSDHSGTVNFQDLVSLAQNYNQSMSIESSTLTAIGGAAFAADFAVAQSLVPEPTTLSAIGLLAATMIRRRR